MVSSPEALAVCFWAESKSAGGDERGEMIVRYCRKHGVGRYDRRLIEAPEITYHDNEHERRVRGEEM